jgi:hypothetical protein
LTEDEWRDGMDDALVSRRVAKWKQIMVTKTGVAKKWPFRLSEVNQSAEVESGKGTASQPRFPRTGGTGRPSPTMHFVLAEHLARWERNEAVASVKAEAEALRRWVLSVHPDLPPPQPTTIENRIREEHRRRKANPRN